jgi:hypothetical protein
MTKIEMHPENYMFNEGDHNNIDIKEQFNNGVYSPIKLRDID